MKRLKKTTIATAIGAGFAILAAAGPANAYVMASSMVYMSDFVIRDSGGNILNYVTDFAGLTFTSTADQSATLDGTTASNSGGAAPIDYAPICVGAGCNPILPDNTFPKLTAPPTTGNYAAADQYEAGAPIQNLPGFATGADVASGAYVGLDTGSSEGSSTSNNNLNASWVFTVDQDGGITFEFDIDAFLQVAVTSDEVFPSFATASLQVTWTLTDLLAGTTVWSYEPAIFPNPPVNGNPIPPTTTISLNAPLPIDIQIIRNTGGPIAFSSTTGDLTAGTLYQLSARITTLADAERVAVPEPSALALMGIGLLGIGAARIRRRYA